MYARNNPELLQLFLQHAPAAVAMLDREMRYLCVSRRWLTDCGLSQRDITGCSHYEIFPEITDSWRAMHQRCLAGKVERDEYSFIKSDGSREWVKWEIHPWHNSSGEVGGIIIFSEAIATAQELRKSEEQLRLALNAAQMGIWDWDIETGEVSCSEKIDLLYGLAPGDTCTSEVFLNILHPEDKELVREAIANAIAGVSDFEIEYRIIWPNGSIRWIASKGDVLRDETGKAVRMVGALTDISDRKQALSALQQYQENLEEKVQERTRELNEANKKLQAEIADRQQTEETLRQREQQLLLAMSAAGMAVWSWDFTTDNVTNYDGKSHYGLETGAVYSSESFFNSIHPDDRDRVDKAVRAAIDDRANYDIDFRIISADGSVGWIRCKGDVLRETDRATGMAGISMDVTARKVAEKALRQTEARFQKLAANVPGVIYQFHLETNGTQSLTYVSSGCRELWELEPHEAQENFERVFAQIHPDDRQQFERSVAVSAETLQPWQSEWRIVTPSGRLKWTQGFSRPEKQANGDIIWDGVIADISDRVCAQQEQDQFFQLSLEMLCIADFDGYFKQLNPAWENTLGWTLEELKSKPFIEFVHPDDREATIGVAQKLAQGNEIVVFENRYRCKDGTYKWLLWNTAVNQQQQMLYAVARDVTDRKLASEQLRESEEFLRSIYNGVEQAIFVVDVDGNGVFRYIDWNPSTEIVTGISSEEACGKTPEELFGYSVGSPLQQNYRKCLLAGGSISYEDTIILQGVNTHWLATLNPCRDAAGQIYRIVGTSTNITDLKFAREEQQKLLFLVENCSDFIGIASLEGQTLFVNDGGQKLIGLDGMEQVKRTLMFDYIMPEDFVDFTERLLPTVMERGRWEGEFRLRHFQTGAEIPVLLNLFTLKDPQTQEPIAFAATTRNITEFKQVLEELHKSEEQFRANFEQVAVGFTHADQTGRFILINQKFCDIVGYTREELLSLTFQDITHPDDLEIDLQYLQQLLANEIENFSSEKRYIHKDGSIVWVNLTISTVQEADGQIAYFIGAIEDISDRVSAESALRESEARLREQAMRENLLNRLSSQIRNSLELDIILETTVREIRSLLQIDRTTFAWYKPDADPPIWEVIEEAKNSDLPSHLGVYPIALVGSINQLLLNGEVIRIDEVSALTEPGFQEFLHLMGCRSTLTIPIQTRAGEIGLLTCVHSNSVRPWSDDEVELLQAIVDQLAIAINQAELYSQSRQATAIARAQTQQLGQTLQELQRTQTQLVQSEKMSSLGQLVAGVAHEINNPVNFIYGNLVHATEYTQDLLGLIELYQQQYPNPTPEIQDEIEAIDLDFLIADLPKLLSSMKVGADRIREIVQSLRNFSRLDEAEMKTVDIHEGIESTLMILANRIKAKPEHPAIEIIKEYGNLPVVDCYAGQLNQVFMNLLTNAIDALDDRDKGRSLSEIKANPSTIKIHTSISQNKCVVIRIADNGSGMTEAVRQQLFNPFFTTKPVGKGTGLGLSISYSIVTEKHGGCLKCVSSPGQGAEFAIEIPICQQEQKMALLVSA